MSKTRLLSLLALGWMAAAPLRLPAQRGASDALMLRPGDLVRISIWREPELSGDFQVDESGRVTLPMLGVKQVDRTPMAALRDTLMREYLLQLRNPSITITPLRRISIMGEVERPGLYPVDPTVSLLGALALAGGTRPDGDITRVSLVRDGRPMNTGLSTEASLDQLDVRSGDQVVVGKRSWGSRNSAMLLASVISLLTTVIIVVTK